MFSFHKPRVYRSPTGCCICKAKSSSSRFTDSKKYEDDFVECFELKEEKRSGEICNACVLLVKRFKKLLPSGRAEKNWHHVVDARAGPGQKSMTKFKSKKKNKDKKIAKSSEKLDKRKHVYIKALDRDRDQSPMISDDEMRSKSYEGRTQQMMLKKKKSHPLGVFMPMTDYFKREEHCCGFIYRGPFGEVISERKPCAIHSPEPQQQASEQQQEQNTDGSASTSPMHSSGSTSPSHSFASASPMHSPDSVPETIAVGKLPKVSSEGEDSGYDDYSNQGEGKLAKFAQTKLQAKPAQPLEDVQLKEDMPLQPLEQMECEPIAALVGALNESSANVATNPLVDFAIHASSRQSLSN